MPTMIAPAPFFQVQGVTATYTADFAGIISNVAFNDVTALRQNGCEQVGLGSGVPLIGRLVAANANITTDQPIPMFNGSQAFRVTKITFKNASTSLTTAAGSVYTAVSKGGTAATTTPTTTAYSSLTTNLLILDLTLLAAFTNIVFAAGAGIWWSLTTAQGAAATVDIFVYGELAS